jgi:hypothetical protein
MLVLLVVLRALWDLQQVIPANDCLTEFAGFAGFWMRLLYCFACGLFGMMSVVCASLL